MERSELNKLTESIIGAAIEVHQSIGPGLLESAYQICLARELALLKITFEQEVALPVEYKGVKLESGYRLEISWLRSRSLLN